MKRGFKGRTIGFPKIQLCYHILDFISRGFQEGSIHRSHHASCYFWNDGCLKQKEQTITIDKNFSDGFWERVYNIDYRLNEEHLEMLICKESVLEFCGSFSAVIDSQFCSFYSKMKLTPIRFVKFRDFFDGQWANGSNIWNMFHLDRWEKFYLNIWNMLHLDRWEKFYLSLYDGTLHECHFKYDKKYMSVLPII